MYADIEDLSSIKRSLDKHRDDKGAVERVTSICLYCGVGCTLELNVKDDEIFGVSTHHGLGFNKGNLCIKGRLGWSLIYGDGRVRQPMAKTGEGLKPISWDEALQTVIDNFSTITNLYGPDAIGGFGSARCTNEDNYMFQKFMRTVIGTNNLDSSTSLVNNNITVPLEDAFGLGGATNTYEQVLAAQAIVVIGDISESHPVFGQQIQTAVMENDAKLITLSPKKVKLDGFGALSVRHKVGREYKVLMAIAAELANQDLIDKDFIKNRTTGFDKFRESLSQVSVQDISGDAGVDMAVIKEAADIINRSQGVMFVFNRYTLMATTQLVVNIALMTGNVGKFGAGVMPLLEFNNSQGMRDMGVIPDFLPGYVAVNDENNRSKFAASWGSPIPANPGRNVIEMIDDINQGRIKALYIMGDNPINHIAPSIKEVLNQLDFLVVQDMFFDEVAEVADIVLPACSFAEKDGTFTNTDRRIQMVNQAISPVADSRPDWWIISQLAAGMGHDMEFGSAFEIMGEIARVNSLYSGVDYKRLDERGVHWPCAKPGSVGECILYRESFGHKDKAQFLEISEPRDIKTYGQFDLDLIFGPSRKYSGSISRQDRQLSGVMPRPYVDMHPDDAKARGLEHGDFAKVESATGAITARIKTTENVVMGSVFIPNFFVDNSPSLLAYPSYDEIKKVIEYPPLKVKVSKQQP